MMGRSQRAKGARGEREAAAFWKPVWPDCARRTCGEESQEDRGRDLKNTPGWCVQCKTTARPNPLAALAEAISAAHDGEIPLAHCRRVISGRPAGEPPTVTMLARDARLLICVYDRFRAAFPRRVEELRRECDAQPEKED